MRIEKVLFYAELYTHLKDLESKIDVLKVDLLVHKNHTKKKSELVNDYLYEVQEMLTDLMHRVEVEVSNED